MWFSLTSFNFVHALIILFPLYHLALAYVWQPICHDNERSALMQFKQSLIINPSASSDPSAYPKIASWKVDEENKDCCSWKGIKCNEETGHVVKLDLASSFLYGSINSRSSLFHLVHLQWLSLADNDFNSSNIPSGIINLKKLSYLNLSYALFSGQIPSEILELSKLESLDVSKNNLELQNPSLTDLVEKLFNLNVLDLGDVDVSTSIPHAMTNLSFLTSLSLKGCRLQGILPSSIGNLTKLLYLDISSNNFHSALPTSIENLVSLSYFDASSSFFLGKIPPSLGSLTKLYHLDLSFNRFFGELPTSLGNLTQVTYLAISTDNFFGPKSDSLSWISNLKRLTTLILSLSNLTGEIPSALTNLTQLTELDLSSNQLIGPIPTWLMNLNKLVVVNLDSNQLFGHIPLEIKNLTQLQYLSVESNGLQGPIPSSIFELKNLHVLDLFSNNLSGKLNLNMFFLNMRSLEILVLSSNMLSLHIGTTVNTILQKFSVIGFGSCNLGEFPYFLHNQDQLVALDLSSNKIAGQLPRWFLNVSKNYLNYLNLSNNVLTGFEHHIVALPWTGLSTLDLRFNKLQVPLPVPSVSIFSYLVSSNQLTGEISPQICSLNHLHALDLSDNNLSGILPECLGNFSYELSVLKLQGNNFRGSIPQTFMNGTNLKMIDLSNNFLEGRIPKSLANCVKLKFLHLGNNQIIDIFPSWLGSLPELEVLILKFNRFQGVIKEPKTGFEFPKLHIIDLSHNNFTGNLPSKYFQCWNAMKDITGSKLTYLQDLLQPSRFVMFINYGFSDYSLTLSNKGTELEYEKLSNLITAIVLSNNKFVGEIPTSVTNLKGLRNLNLSNNNLEGRIPSSLNNLILLESLDLSSNKLSGEIPQQLVELTTLAFFNVSNNHLTGPIPRGKQFNTFENASFDGNPELCGDPLSKKCENSLVSPEEDPHSESLLAFGWKIVLIGYASGTIIGVVLGHIFSSRKHEWLAKTFRLHPKTIERRKRRRSN